MHVTESVNCIPLSQLDVRELTRPSPFLLEGLASETRHTCTTLLAGKNFGNVIIQIMLTAKTNFRYVKMCSLYVQNFGTQNELALSQSTRSKSCLLKSRLRYAKAGL